MGLKIFQSNTALQAEKSRIDNLIDETQPLMTEASDFETRDLSDLIKKFAIHRPLRCRRKKFILWFLAAVSADVKNFRYIASKSKSAVPEK